ncbi:MAG TPA: valine--tRNA ligase [Puia sp.]|nr:valine--tRNA ligase [Puia sp.]
MELSKNYTPALVEEKWTRLWQEKKYFKSVPDSRKPFTVTIPPPNVTGVLHMGHTLNETVQDILVRRARMSGFNACWVPGSDHASIATEAKVVDMLKKKGIDKNNLTREEFLKYAFEWKEKYGGIIYSQIEKLGCSVDWDRVTFTMDDHYYKAVIKVFVELYNNGLIYRGARMINWDPSAKTALSDEEVEYKEVTGKLYYVKYKVAGGQQTDEYIIIATQRPETIMGDTAVCVNPADDRYAHLKGMKVIVPLVNREVPVIFDEYVDQAFGTGALKITPAHDINDYNIGLKYNLPIIDTLNEDGTLSHAAEVFIGLDRFEARKKAVEKLKAEGLLVKEEDYQTRMGFSQRTNAVVEPRISTQWFLKMKELAKPALDAVLNGGIKIHPEERFLNTYKYWLENVKDWCISRQLWWGQRIPAWYDANGNVYVAETEEAAGVQLQASSSSGLQLVQDEDVLDTWFSSWLWPMEVFNGITDPDHKDFNYYYPTSVLVTGQDIIFFWVSRMIMAGFQFKHQKPFSDVYFTGMVRDKLGRKMSKSLGNSPDLLELIDKYGADAVRFGIMISSPAGNDLLFDEASLEQGRNFNNKLWNVLKLIKLWEQRKTNEYKDVEEYDFATEWFQSKLNYTRNEINVLINQFSLSEALKKIYSLIWDDFCSWYIEWVKPLSEDRPHSIKFDKTIYFFEELLQLLHPFMPFITEEIYHLLKERPIDDDLTIKQYPSQLNYNSNILNEGELLKRAITTIREFRSKNQLGNKNQIELTIHPHNENYEAYEKFRYILPNQVNSTWALNVAINNQASKIIVSKDTFFIKTEQVLNKDNQKQDLLKDLEYQKGFLQSVMKKLGNERFVQNAKPEVIALEQKKKADAEAKIKVLEESLANL